MPDCSCSDFMLKVGRHFLVIYVKRDALIVTRPNAPSDFDDRVDPLNSPRS